MPPIDDTADQTEPRLSLIFRELARNADGPVTIGRIRDAMGDRGFAALLLLFAAINLVPVPPGASLILGLPLILVSVQMVLGLHTPWLPQSIAVWAIPPARFRSACDRLVPWLERLEELVRPRWWPFPHAHDERIIGVIALVLSFAAFLPVPFANWIPALAIALVSLALAGRDGAFLAAGLAVGAVALTVIATLIGTASALAAALFGL